VYRRFAAALRHPIRNPRRHGLTEMRAFLGEDLRLAGGGGCGGVPVGFLLCEAEREPILCLGSLGRSLFFTRIRPEWLAWVEIKVVSRWHRHGLASFEG
jgi:hypothetical protein